MTFVGELPKRRKRYLCTFDKVRILYRPTLIMVMKSDLYPDAPYQLYYRSGAISEIGGHFVRAYKSPHTANDAAKRLQHKFAKPGLPPIPIYLTKED